MSENISLSEEQIGTLCYLLRNFCMSLYFLLLKAYKEIKGSNFPSWIEQPEFTHLYEDILRHPFAEWSHERKQEMEQLEDDIGKDKAQRVLEGKDAQLQKLLQNQYLGIGKGKTQGVLEEAVSFLIFFIASFCRPYVLEGEVEKLLNRFYKVMSTEWTPIFSFRDRHIKYAGARNPIEKFSIDLAIILGEDVFTGLKFGMLASEVARDIRFTIDKFFKESH